MWTKLWKTPEQLVCLYSYEFLGFHGCHNMDCSLPHYVTVQTCRCYQRFGGTYRFHEILPVEMFPIKQNVTLETVHFIRSTEMLKSWEAIPGLDKSGRPGEKFQSGSHIFPMRSLLFSIGPISLAVMHFQLTMGYNLFLQIIVYTGRLPANCKDIYCDILGFPW
jgi:hypothetical protein